MRAKEGDRDIQFIDLEALQASTPKKKPDRVITFDEMRTQLDQAPQEFQAKVDLQPSDGYGSGASGAMTFANDAWMAPSVLGYDEVGNFYQRMARATNWGPKSGPAAER